MQEPSEVKVTLKGQMLDRSYFMFNLVSYIAGGDISFCVINILLVIRKHVSSFKRELLQLDFPNPHHR